MVFLVAEDHFLTSKQAINIFSQEENILIFDNTKKDSHFQKSIEKTKKEV